MTTLERIVGYNYCYYYVGYGESEYNHLLYAILLYAAEEKASMKLNMPPKGKLKNIVTLIMRCESSELAALAGWLK